MNHNVVYKQLLFCDIQECSKCTISSLKINNAWEGKAKVPGGGNINANVFLIGLAPSFYRDNDVKAGHPFNLFVDEMYDVPEAGKKVGNRTRMALENLLKNSGIDKKYCYVSNALKCSTEKDREPMDEELNTCFSNFLLREINIIQPTLIIGFGAVIRNFLQIQRFNVMEKRKDVRFIATYHPTYYVYKSDSDRFNQSAVNLKEAVTDAMESKRWKTYL